MSKQFIENPIKIYLKDSDKARLADKRIRIVRETNPHEPCDNEDLVFEKAEDESLIPANALFKWSIEMSDGPRWFFTTAERCKKMVSPDPSYWTVEKLQEFAKIEKKIYENWRDGDVYGYVVEYWNEKCREWAHISSLWGMYGTEELIYQLSEMLDQDSIICMDEEWMKYEFDNTEKKINEF